MQEVVDDFKFLSTPMRWPLWPFCPLIGLKDKRDGIMIDGSEKFDGKQFTIFELNYFSLTQENFSEKIAAAPPHHYNSLEEICQEWRVD